MKQTIALILLAASMLTLSACNTVQGMGKDVQAVGEKMQDAGKK
jgi:predicted small secreted protein